MSTPGVQIFVRAIRESSGLISRFAHDVELRLERFDVVETGTSLRACFDLTSLRVVGRVCNGSIDRTSPNARDRAEIENNVRREVLLTSQHPKGRFEGQFEGTHEDDVVQIRGELELLGRRHALAFPMLRQGERFIGNVVLTPSDWGIRPYRALLGALKLQDRVEVRVEVDRNAR